MGTEQTSLKRKRDDDDADLDPPVLAAPPPEMNEPASKRPHIDLFEEKYREMRAQIVQTTLVHASSSSVETPLCSLQCRRKSRFVREQDCMRASLAEFCTRKIDCTALAQYIIKHMEDFERDLHKLSSVPFVQDIRPILPNSHIVGTLDLLPKFAYPELEAKVGDVPTFSWWGAVVMHLAAPEALPVDRFRIVDNLDAYGSYPKTSMYVVLCLDIINAPIFINKGYCPAVFSVAEVLEEVPLEGKDWYHIGLGADRTIVGLIMTYLKKTYDEHVCIMASTDPIKLLQVAAAV